MITPERPHRLYDAIPHRADVGFNAVLVVEYGDYEFSLSDEPEAVCSLVSPAVISLVKAPGATQPPGQINSARCLVSRASTPTASHAAVRMYGRKNHAGARSLSYSSATVRREPSPAGTTRNVNARCVTHHAIGLEF